MTLLSRVMETPGCVFVLFLSGGGGGIRRSVFVAWSWFCSVFVYFVWARLVFGIWPPVALRGLGSPLPLSLLGLPAK